MPVSRIASRTTSTCRQYGLNDLATRRTVFASAFFVGASAFGVKRFSRPRPTPAAAPCIIMKWFPHPVETETNTACEALAERQTDREVPQSILWNMLPSKRVAPPWTIGQPFATFAPDNFLWIGGSHAHVPDLR